MRQKLAQMLGGLVILGLSGIANGSLIWTMAFDDDLPRIIRPIDTVVINATLSNSAASTENLGIIGGFLGEPTGFDFEVGAAAFEPFPTSIEYVHQFGPDPVGNIPGAFGDQFEGVNLAPGESFGFVFAFFTPRDGTVRLGDYSYFGEIQLFGATAERPRLGSRSDSINWSVVVNVPEPGTLALFAIGLAAMGLSRRRKQLA